MSKKYFGAVIDFEDSYGTLKEIKHNKNVETDRYFNNKFVNSPELALAVACDISNLRNKNVSMEDILKNVTFDSEYNEYTFIEYLTSNYNTPTSKQFERFNNNEHDFRLHKMTFKVQVYETLLNTSNLIDKAKKLKFPTYKNK